MDNKINVYLVRHGQTYFNLFGRFQGWSDIELTDKGIEDARDAGERLKRVHFDDAYSSDLSRAYDTAQYILNANKNESPAHPTTLRDFREIFFGTFDGLPSEEVVSTIDPNLTSYNKLIEKYGSDETLNLFKEKDPNHLAENSSEFWKRINHGFAELVETHPVGGNILLVAHGSVIRALGARYKDPKLATHPIGNGAVTLIEIDQYNNLEIVDFNDETKNW
ncbi:MAG: histidine phosphatase family protein [Lactobacillaceae bacterium]|jgi:probable phosphoglycerate mutase|nr:histidine phosphatase family protein [Lactobacillaceae bacterium]